MRSGRSERPAQVLDTRSTLHPSLEALAELLQLGWDDRDAVGVALPLAGPVILVIILGRVPFGLRLDGCRDLAVILLIGPLDRRLRRVALGFVLREDRRTILGADVIALPVDLGRVMSGEENVEQVVEAELLRVKGDANRLGMAGI